MKPILVVDDNEQIVGILSRYIRQQGWPLLTAQSGEEALALFEAADPSVILLDIMLPGIDGLEVCRRILTKRSLSAATVNIPRGRGRFADSGCW